MSISQKDFFESKEEENSWSRFKLICKPEQSGKTFIMIQEIIKSYEESDINMMTILYC